jgi:hypothetical protein
MDDISLQGPGMLSPEAFEELTLAGSYLAQMPEDAPLPRTYKIAAGMADTGLREALADPQGYWGLLPHVERLAAQGMSLRQIAERLGLSQGALREAWIFLPEVRLALTGGRARGIDDASRTIALNIDKGDTASAVFLLKTKGDYVPASTKQAPAVVVSIGAQPAMVTFAAIEDIRDRMAALADEVDYAAL